MADLRRHEGLWSGQRTILSTDGTAPDTCASKVVCTFPKDGPYAFRQEEEYLWDDGRADRSSIGGRWVEGELWFDTEDFSGRAWTSRGAVLFDMTRKDAANCRVQEVWHLGRGGAHRARTAHWFVDGRCTRRTIYDEEMV